MTDLTPEERADKVAQEFPATPYIDDQWRRKIADEISAAVEAAKKFGMNLGLAGVDVAVDVAVEAAIKKNNYVWEVEYVKGVAAERERCAAKCEASRRVMPIHDETIEEAVAFTLRRVAAEIRKEPADD